MKAYKILLGVAIVVLVSLIAMSLPILMFRYIGMTRYYVEYDSCRDELAMLVEYLEDYREKESPAYLFANPDGTLYNPETKYRETSDALCAAVRKIHQDGFVCKDANWDVIRFKENRIQLDILNGTYALVWSPDGRPKYIHSPDEENRIFVQHIEGGWYHVSKVS